MTCQVDFNEFSEYWEEIVFACRSTKINLNGAKRSQGVGPSDATRIFLKC